ncbi:IS110 family transposase [Arthrobacter sp. E918]|uniref:IS110 family transposase n=1 Tax=Arthrobacter mobilis TaxID=2724944 RepID=A0A7X6QM52_9MICC|nr:IS110 family transposase [Arthrobacter mobilis]
MVVFGTDVHKKTHTVVAVDAAGRELGQVTVPATAAGHGRALRWARNRFAEADRVWGIEDCRHLSARLEQDLLAAGETVVRVFARLMARSRASARTRGKSDPIDALAVARAVLREPDLPRACHDAASRELKLLVDRREDLVAERTRAVNRLRWHLHELDPGMDPAPLSLDRAAVRDRLKDWLAGRDGIVAELAAEILGDIDPLTGRVNDLERRISRLVADCEPRLLALPGCGPLTAAKLVGEIAGRVRLNRGGNRQVNCALHRIAVTQIRLPGPGRDYYRRKLAEGKSTTEALRCLKRQLAKTVHKTLTTTAPAAETACQPAAA